MASLRSCFTGGCWGSGSASGHPRAIDTYSLVGQLEKLGRKDAGGRLVVTFGELLGDECAQVETLVTLNIELSVLKSKGVVYFEAKQPLLQGDHDKVEIFLLKPTAPEAVSAAAAAPKSSAAAALPPSLHQFLTAPAEGEQAHTEHAAACPAAPAPSNRGRAGACPARPSQDQPPRVACPFGHGTVGASPYPGYVHGTRPAICPAGCTPSLSIPRSGVAPGESATDTLIREALEYQALYSRERNVPPEQAAERREQILRDIAETGTYAHTHDELQHGARVAWRNAPKCANRKQWEELHLIDARGARTPAEMFSACLSLLERASETFATSTNILVFRPQTPGTEDGPRVWNSQLLRFAGHRPTPQSPILGDPAELGFAQLLETEFGWEPPNPRTAFDIMPLLLQASPDTAPELFEIPPHYCPTVPLSHPRYPWFSELRLRWYAIPVVSSLEFTCGGLLYTAAPFSGWYSVTEICRNLTDPSRYDLSRLVATRMGIDTRTEATLWRDLAISEVGAAVLHSFAVAGFAMTDHHTLLAQFHAWYRSEMRNRGFCPGNWKWIIPPMAAAANTAYLGLNTMTEYTLRPGYFGGPGWRRLRARWLAASAEPAVGGGVVVPSGSSNRGSNRGSHRGDRGGLLARGASARAPSSIRGVGALFQVGVSFRRFLAPVQARRGKVLVLFATSSGTARQVAREVHAALRGSLHARVRDVAELPVASLACEVGEVSAVLFITSTAGSGEVPRSARKVMTWLADGADGSFKGKPVSVLALGSRAYPRFCAAGDAVHAALLGAGALPLLPEGPAKVDALDGAEATRREWLRRTALALAEKEVIPRPAAELVAAACSLAGGAAGAKGGASAAASAPLYACVLLSGYDHPAVDPTVRLARVQQVTLLEDTPAKAAGGSGGASRTTVVAHIRLLLRTDAADVDFDAGDEVAVFAENSLEDVLSAAEGLGLSADTLHRLFDLRLPPTAAAAEAAEAAAGEGGAAGQPALGEEERAAAASPAGLVPPPPFPVPTTFYAALAQHVALADPVSFAALTALWRGAAPSDPALSSACASFRAFSEAVTNKGVTWAGVFRAFPALKGAVSLAQFFDVAPLIRPRYYSVASAPRRGPTAKGASGEPYKALDIAVSLLQYTTPTGSTAVGFASGWLCSLAAGDTVRLKIVRLPAFRMPLDIRAPVLLVAAGVGIAPVRAMLQERALRLKALPPGHAPGEALFVFGCRSTAPGAALFREEVSAFEADGVVRVKYALSREPGRPRTFVQDVIASDEEVAALLRRPKCQVIVCGGAAMADSAEAAVERIVGEAEFRALRAEGRLKLDVFGQKPTEKQDWTEADEDSWRGAIGRRRSSATAGLTPGGGGSKSAAGGAGAADDIISWVPGAAGPSKSMTLLPSVAAEGEEESLGVLHQV